VTLSCFPTPVPGELLYGVLARHGLLIGSPNDAWHATELFGRRHAVASFDLPSHLNALAARLPSSTRLNAEALLTHTLFHFYTAFQTVEGRSSGRDDMLVRQFPNSHLRLGVNAFSISANQALRYCAECIVEQNALLTFSTWMVVHQLPGVPICSMHGCLLENSSVTRTSVGKHGYVALSPTNCPNVIAKKPKQQAGFLLTDLARRAVAIATTLRPAHSLHHWREHYTGRLLKLGMMRSPHSANQNVMNEKLSSYWGPALSYLPPPCAKFCEQGWSSAMVRRHRKVMHPLFHLMMESFLEHLEAGGSILAISTHVTTATKQNAGLLSTNPQTGRRPRIDWRAIDVDLVRRVRAEAAHLRMLDPPVRVRAAEIERRIRKRGWFVKRKYKVPSAVRALAAEHETLDAFRLRRIDHWVRVLGPKCQAWEVMRAAGLTSEHLPTIRQAMAMRQTSASAKF